MDVFLNINYIINLDAIAKTDAGGGQETRYSKCWPNLECEKIVTSVET